MRPRSHLAPTREGPRTNQEIRAPQVRLIDEAGRMVGVVGRDEAIAKAVQAGLDLIEVSAQAEPPVCKILDFGKFKYEEQKRKHEAKRHQRTVEVKEIQLRPAIGEHDYQVKLRNARQFIEDGDKIRVVLRFRGREITHKEIGMSLLERVRGDLAAVAKIEHPPRFEGKQVVMILAPQ